MPTAPMKLRLIRFSSFARCAQPMARAARPYDLADLLCFMPDLSAGPAPRRARAVAMRLAGVTPQAASGDVQALAQIECDHGDAGGDREPRPPGAAAVGGWGEKAGNSPEESAGGSIKRETSVATALKPGAGAAGLPSAACSAVSAEHS